ncbi:MAG TPA: TIGR00296 family protein [candidate division Zixibacteria bacterium]|nr:TIGR00296 family protein [candidate division Zixibacteria bacterium]
MSESKDLLEYDLNDGKYLVTLARKSILHYLTFRKLLPIPRDTSPKLREESGVFVTLNKLENNKNKSLRGCIGFPLPIYPLAQATIEAAKSAAVGDPRFPTVEIDEMKKIIIEVTILTKPRKLIVNDSKEYLDLIKIGRDGLIIRKGGWSGLLLPQVPVEWKWDVKEFLEHTCNKAGLQKDCWKEKETSIESFSGIIYHEIEPNGKVEYEEI